MTCSCFISLVKQLSCCVLWMKPACHVTVAKATTSGALSCDKLNYSGLLAANNSTLAACTETGGRGGWGGVQDNTYRIFMCFREWTERQQDWGHQTINTVSEQRTRIWWAAQTSEALAFLSPALSCPPPQLSWLKKCMPDPDFIPWSFQSQCASCIQSGSDACT